MAKNKQAFLDTLITSKIKGLFIQKKLFTDKDIAAMTITVETHHGVVFLRGTVNNEEQIKNAIKISKSIKGVRKVHSYITIKSH